MKKSNEEQRKPLVGKMNSLRINWKKDCWLRWGLVGVYCFYIWNHSTNLGFCQRWVVSNQFIFEHSELACLKLEELTLEDRRTQVAQFRLKFMFEMCGRCMATHFLAIFQKYRLRRKWSKINLPRSVLSPSALWIWCAIVRMQFRLLMHFKFQWRFNRLISVANTIGAALSL